MKISPRLKKRSERERAGQAGRGSERERLAPVREADQEERTEAEPDGRVVDPPAERPVVAARHLPGHLRPGPGLRDPARRVLELDERDLPGLARGPDLHGPDAAFAVELAVVRELLSLVTVEPVANLGVRQGRARRLLLVQAHCRRRRSSWGTNGVSTRFPLRVVDGSLRRGRRLGEGARHADERRHRCGDEQNPQRPKLQSLFATKFHGVTSAIATACAGTFGRPSATSVDSAARLTPSAMTETSRNRIPW